VIVSVDVPAALARLTPRQTEGRLDLDSAVYFLSKVVMEADGPGALGWELAGELAEPLRLVTPGPAGPLTTGGSGSTRSK
jgi:hypothetical protein